MSEIYKYNARTKEYTGVGQGQLDPLETKIQKENIYLVPANATIIAPPEPEEGKVIIFEDGGWIKKDDNRDKTIYDKTTGISTTSTQIDVIDGYTLIERPDESYKWETDNWIHDKTLAKEKAIKDKLTEDVVAKETQDRLDAIEQLKIDGVLDSKGDFK